MTEDNIRVIPNAKFVATLRSGDDWTVCGEYIIIANPDYPPRAIKIGNDAIEQFLREEYND